MAKTTDKVYDAADNVKPYVQRALQDEKLREDVMSAFATAKELYTELVGGRGAVTLAPARRDRRRGARQAPRRGRRPPERGRPAAGRKNQSKSHTRLLVAGSRSASSSTRSPGPETRRWLKDMLAAAATTSADDYRPSNGGSQLSRTGRLAGPAAPEVAGRRHGRRHEGLHQRRAVDGASARSSEPGSSPSAVEMSCIPSRIAPGSGAGRAGSGDRRGPAAGDRERQVLLVLPRVEVRRRVDSAVVAEVEERHRVDLEVEVVRRSLGVAGVAHEADHLPGLHVRAVDGGGRERGEVRVVELVALPVDDPEPVAADLVEADGEDVPSVTRRAAGRAGRRCRRRGGR